MIAMPLAETELAGSERPLVPTGNVLMGRNALGTWLDTPRASVDFQHPWLVSVAGNGARIGRGYVIAAAAVEPRIGKVAISGEARQAVPELELDAKLTNDAGESWLCVQVKPDADGKLADQDGKLIEGVEVKIVQSIAPTATTGEVGRAPLALLILEGSLWQVWQIAFFHFKYSTAVNAAGQRRHFFL